MKWLIVVPILISLGSLLFFLFAPAIWTKWDDD